MQQAFDNAKENMIDSQIRPNKVTNEWVLEAMRRVPREKFVPRALQRVAYADGPIDLGRGRRLAEPMVFAQQLQAAHCQKGDVVLDIGCATGYSSAVLGLLGGTVVGLESGKEMAQEADQLLRGLDICNAAIVVQQDLRKGYAQQGPYNVIFINGSVPEVPEEIKMQLAEHGRLITVLSPKGHMGHAVMITRLGAHFSTQVLFDAAMPTLGGFEAPHKFVF